MPVRKVDTLQISEEDKEYLLKEIYPYWENRCTGDISRYYIDESIMKVLDSPYRVFNHSAEREVDMDIICLISKRYFRVVSGGLSRKQRKR